MIVVDNFIKKYDEFIAVNNISFRVKQGSIFAFLGPNGAGKSTTINTLCTISDKTSGELIIAGKDVTREKQAVRNLIGVVFQETTLDNKMTVEENLKMHGYFYNMSKKMIEKRIEEVLEIVDLLKWKRAAISSLSGGMKRRIEIARSLLHSPQLLFLDEPTTGLDPQTRANIWEYMIRLQQEENMTIFLSTHYMEEAEICDSIAVIDHGQIIAFDEPNELKRKYTKDIATIISNDDLSMEGILDDYEIPYKKVDNHFVVELNSQQKLLIILSKYSGLIQDIEIKKGTLNDVFLELTGRNIREGV